MNNGIAGYGRLSQEEEKERGTSMEQKIALRRDILKTIAKHHGLQLLDDAITFEIRSGATLSERPGLLDLLEQCRRREVHTLIVFDVDRLTRDVADLKTITQALFKGEVRLVTQRGVYQFDRHFDTTLLQILAVLGEKERRSYCYRRKAANEQRSRSGQRSCGIAPYGYTWDSDAKRYEVIPAEYAIVEELFLRIWNEGGGAIASDLNRRGVAPPGTTRRLGASPVWMPVSVLNIVRNPHYAGRPAKRRDSDREGVSIHLPRQQWILSDEEITAVHPDTEGGRWFPVTLDEWEGIQEVLNQRHAVGAPRAGLLTGLLRCSQGRPMNLHLDSYECPCRKEGAPHRGSYVQAANVDSVVKAVVAAAIDAQPPTRLPAAKGTPDRSLLELAAARRDLREAEATIGDLTRRSAFYVSLPHFGVAGHEAALREVSEKAATLAQRVAELTAIRNRPDLLQLETLLSVVRAAGGSSAFFSAMEGIEAREMVRLVVKSVTLSPMEPGAGVTKTVEIIIHDLGKGEEVRIESLPRQPKQTVNSRSE